LWTVFAAAQADELFAGAPAFIWLMFRTVLTLRHFGLFLASVHCTLPFSSRFLYKLLDAEASWNAEMKSVDFAAYNGAGCRTNGPGRPGYGGRGNAAPLPEQK